MLDIYVKKHCPYCIRLLELLSKTEYKYSVRDVLEDNQSHSSMLDLSGDEGVPQVHVKNSIIYDYDTEESLMQDIETILEYEEEILDDSWVESHISSTIALLEETQMP